MASVAVIRKFLWVIPVLLGLVFIGAGAYMISEGRAAKDDVHQALKAENVVTAEDASIPKALVHNVSTAEAQDAIIRQHSLETTEGKTYAELPRDDPNRGVYLNGVTLRTALSLAVMGFRVSDLVVGLGVFMVFIGASHIFVLAPTMFWMRNAPSATGASGSGRVPVHPAPTA
ncbi:MAG TPA: hypothetical protein VJ253_03445 [Dehalococcoidia bacterium]|nr:hypothetical protein [Dehalococcoidia bacterium]